VRPASTLTLALVLALALLAPGCIVLSDTAGVSVTEQEVAAIRPGLTARTELLERLGPPTGIYSTDLLALVTQAGSLPDQPATPGRIDDDVLTWQHVRVEATVAFFPILFLWTDARVSNRTLTVFFDEQGLVRHVAWREDEQ
jgi:outer membrane protein assembly factor BamE (lipoprotein component of BamABCDE complex)